MEGVERRLSGDLFFLALKGEGLVSHPKQEVLGRLALVGDAPYPLAELARICVPEPVAWVLHHGSDRVEFGFTGLE